MAYDTAMFDRVPWFFLGLLLGERCRGLVVFDLMMSLEFLSAILWLESGRFLEIPTFMSGRQPPPCSCNPRSTWTEEVFQEKVAPWFLGFFCGGHVFVAWS